MRVTLYSPGLWALALGCLAWPPSPAMAQNDPAARSLIEQLRPRLGNGTRGIRLPPSPEVPASPIDPAVGEPVTPQGPVTSQGPAPGSFPAQPAPYVQAPAQPPVQAETPKTTAPDGVAAVSITVTFPSGSASLTQRAREALAPLGRALSSRDLEAYRFRIEGHTDSVGDDRMNQRLSELRARSVRDWLVKQYGVAPQRLEAVGLGESELLVPTGDGVDEPRNRRVQIINLDG